MIEAIKKKVWDVLKDKEVSLAMIYNHAGEIVWHKGREITGRTVREGQGFSKTFIKKSLKESRLVEEESVLSTVARKNLPESARMLRIQGLLIQPLTGGYYLYVDSGSRESFSPSDREVFKVLGELLGSLIEKIRSSEVEAGGITGESPAIKQIRDLVLKYSLEEKPVLLLGETGVGKSHVAELIHRYSGRKGKFVTVHTPSVPETLFESEVFGHRRGAFTDARADRKGYVDEARGGTLFLDEVSEVPVSFQAKLLRLIDTGHYSVLGEASERRSDVRIVAASNRDLKAAIRKREFREDLYYRLQVLEVEIPPLRERREDIGPLVMEHLRLLKGKATGEGFWDAICRHDWPGNARELVTVLTRSGILLEAPITGKDIRDLIRGNARGEAANPVEERVEKMWRGIRSGNSFWDEAWQPFIEREVDRETVRRVLQMAYADNRSSFKKMVRALNLEDKEYHLFMSLMHKYRIDPRN